MQCCQRTISSASVNERERSCKKVGALTPSHHSDTTADAVCGDSMTFKLIAPALLAALGAFGILAADMSADEGAILRRVQVPRVLAGIRHLSEDVVVNDSGV